MIVKRTRTVCCSTEVSKVGRQRLDGAACAFDKLLAQTAMLAKDENCAALLQDAKAPETHTAAKSDGDHIVRR